MSNEQFLYGRPQFPAILDMSHPLTRGLVGAWVLNEEGGMRAFDSSPYGNHGTVTGAKGHYDGKLLSGVNEYIRITNVGNLRFGTALTTIAWVYPTAVGGALEHFIVGHLNDSAVNRRSWMLLIDETPAFKFYCSSDGTHASSDSQVAATTPVINTWYQVAATYSPTALTIYVNGMADGTKDPSVNSLYQNVTDDLYIGIDAGLSRDFTGKIGAIWDYNLTLIASDIKSLFLNPWDMFIR